MDITVINETDYVTDSRAVINDNFKNTKRAVNSLGLTLERNTEYVVGDVVYWSGLPSAYYLECTTAGTTSDTEPTVSGGVNSSVSDGDCTFKIYHVGLLSMPIGYLYQSMVATSPADIFGGTWKQITDRFIYAANSSKDTGGSNSVTLAQANLPNVSFSGTAASAGGHTHTRGTMDITGSIIMHGANSATVLAGVSGAFYASYTRSKYRSGGDDTSGATSIDSTIFQASRDWSGETSTNGSHTHDVTVSSGGSGTAFDNRPQYITAYVYYRTA